MTIRFADFERPGATIRGPPPVPRRTSRVFGFGAPWARAARKGASAAVAASAAVPERKFRRDGHRTPALLTE